MTVVVGVMLCSLVLMMLGMLVMPVSHVCVMRSFFMVAVLVMLGCLAVVLSCFLKVLSRFFVMIVFHSNYAFSISNIKIQRQKINSQAGDVKLLSGKC
jgi:hypothetical protein